MVACMPSGRAVDRVHHGPARSRTSIQSRYAAPMSRTPGRIGALRTTPDRALACAALQAFGVTLSWSTGLGVIGGLRPSLERTNFHGRAVSLRGGVGAAAGSVAAGRVAGRLMNARPRAALNA